MIKKMIVLGVVLVMVIALVACGPENKGSFYSLREAYDNGWLTQEDLKSLAYYYNGGSNDESFVPKPKTPEFLSKEIENKIRKTYLSEKKIKKDFPFATIKRISITGYYGIYNDCIIVGVTDDYYRYDYVVEPEYIIGEVLIRNYTSSRLLVWRE